VSEDLGGQPFPDGEEPEYHHHGPADDEFASVVFDEDFVRSAAVHEPSAAERILAAAQSHAESEAARGFEDGYGYGPGGEGEFDADLVDADEDTGDADDPDDEGRFDRSDYSEYVELADGDEYGPYDPYMPYGSYGEYGRSGHYGLRRHDDPRYEPGEEHGSDFRPRYHGSHAPAVRTHRGRGRWHRPVAWLLAVVMGIGMIALALSAVYRGTSSQRHDPVPPPATSGVDSPSTSEHAGAPGALPPTTARTGPPTVSAQRHEG